MKNVFRHKKISSIVSVVPSQEYRFDDEYPELKLTEAKAQRFKKTMSLDRHRIAPADVCSSDLCLFGLQHLLAKGAITTSIRISAPHLCYANARLLYASDQ